MLDDSGKLEVSMVVEGHTHQSIAGVAPGQVQQGSLQVRQEGDVAAYHPRRHQVILMLGQQTDSGQTLPHSIYQRLTCARVKTKIICM